jgi:hypothetical protein
VLALGTMIWVLFSRERARHSRGADATRAALEQAPPPTETP